MIPNWREREAVRTSQTGNRWEAIAQKQRRLASAPERASTPSGAGVLSSQQGAQVCEREAPPGAALEKGEGAAAPCRFPCQMTSPFNKV